MTNLSDFTPSTVSGEVNIRLFNSPGRHTLVSPVVSDLLMYTAHRSGLITKDSSGLSFNAIKRGVEYISSELPGYAILGDGVAINTIRNSFSSPLGKPGGVTFDGTNLISCDSATGVIYIHSGISSAISSQFNAPGPIRDICFDGKNLISCSLTAVYIHQGISQQITSQFTAPTPSTRSLTFDGVNLISSGNSGVIYVHDGISSTVLKQFTTTIVPISGLAYDGDNLYACSPASPASIYTLDGISGTILGSVTTPSSQPQGLVLAGINIISCDLNTGRIYVHGSPLPRQAAIQFITQEA